MRLGVKLSSVDVSLFANNLDGLGRTAVPFARLHRLAAVLHRELPAAHDRSSRLRSGTEARMALIIDAYNTTQNRRTRSDYLTGRAAGPAAAAARAVRSDAASSIAWMRRASTWRWSARSPSGSRTTSSSSW